MRTVAGSNDAAQSRGINNSTTATRPQFSLHSNVEGLRIVHLGDSPPQEQLEGRSTRPTEGERLTMAYPTRAGQALVDGFDSIRVINLVDRRDRRREIVEQLSRLGLSFEHPKISVFEARRFSDAAGFPTPGTRGCFQSHLDLLRDAAAQRLDSILILEDDLNFHDEIEALLPPALEQLDAGNWDMFYGSLLPGQVEASVSPIELLPSEFGVTGAHFYAMRGSAIAQAAAWLEPMIHRPAGQDHPDGEPMHVDGALSVFRRRHPEVQAYVANPDLGHQRLSRTDIHALPIYDRLPGLRGGASLLRRAIKATGRTKTLRR